MTTAGLKTFDSTLQTTNVWLGELMDELHWKDRQRAYHAMRAVLQALRDQLSVDEATDFAAQLPMLMRGFYYEGWHPAHKPLKVRKVEQFLERIAEQLERDPEPDPERIARAVFAVIARHVTEGEVDDVRSSLPKPIRELWP